MTEVVMEERYKCKVCTYSTSRRPNLQRHISSGKHFGSLSCRHCEKSFVSRSGLWRHLTKCESANARVILDSVMRQSSRTVELVTQQAEDNKRMMEKVTDLLDKPTIGIVHNSYISLDVFFNDRCRNAINVKDFIEAYGPQPSDLEEMGSCGYVRIMSKMFIRGLRCMELEDRPIHCSDAKRETMYVREDNTWVKECSDRPILKEAIKAMSHKNVKQIPMWTAKNPTAMDYTSKKNDQYLAIVSQAMGGCTDAENEEYYNKIIRNVSREVLVPKGRFVK